MKNVGQDYQLFARSMGIGSGTLDSYQKYAAPGNISAARLSSNVIVDGKVDYNSMDVFTRLMADRIIVLGTGITDDVANIVNAQLLFLEAEAPTEEITIYINSPGGSCYAGLAMYDIMQAIESPVSTIVTGIAASMAFVLTCAGDKGRRYALPHSRLMQHQPSGDPGNIFMEEMKTIQDDLYTIIAEHTGQRKAKVKRDCERDHWMRPLVAKEYGVIDHVFVGHKRRQRDAEREAAAREKAAGKEADAATAVVDAGKD
jgi:ATP-dependent Clp protease protease subunit